MALVKCKECEQEISKSADKCPNCGAPQKKKTSPVTWTVLVFIVLVWIVGLSSNSQNNHTRVSTKPTPSKSVVLMYAHSPINVRQGAGKQHEIIDKLKRGDAVILEDIENKWAKVKLDNNKIGYVYAPLLKKHPVPPLEIADWNWHTDPDFALRGSVIWNVEVRNNTDQYIGLVKVEFSTYDSSDKLITSDFTYVKGLSPGGTATGKGYATYFGQEKTGRIRIAQ